LKEANTTSGSALSSSDFKDPYAAVENLEGASYFSMDVVHIDENKINETMENAELAHDGSTLTFMEPRSAMSSLDAFTAAIFAEARSMVNWNQRNKACFGILQYRRHMLKHNKPTSSVLLVVHPYIHRGLDGSCAARLYFPGPIMQTRNLVPLGLSKHYIGGNNH
jgi:hypothetical protein